MKTRSLAAAVLMVILASVAAGAETRWCDVTGRGANDTIVYPPIAKAARVSGLVMGRVLFTPEGKVTGFEPIRGPVMLQESLRQQLSTWTVQTPASGTEACQTLVVAEFKSCFTEDSPCPEIHAVAFEQSILRIQTTTSGSKYICILAEAVIGPPRNPIRHAWYSTRRTVRKLFHRNQ